MKPLSFTTRPRSSSRRVTTGAVVTTAALLAATIAVGTTQSSAEALSVDNSQSLSGDGVGPYQWGPNVTLEAFDWDGNPAAINLQPGWRDRVFGVAGGRWGDQIDYTSTGGGRGESMVVRFDSPVRNVTLEMGMVGAGEGGRDGGAPIDEAGMWIARDAAGIELGRGLISPEFSALGSRVK